MHMRLASACFLLGLTMPVEALAGGIGVFTDVRGDTRIQRADEYLAAAPGVEVEQDDIVETGAAASAQVEMNDGTTLRLGADSRLLLADYMLDDDGHVVAAGLEVLSGWMRFAVSRLRVTDSRFDINTPTMTIGIRGTEGVVKAANERGGLFLEAGEVAVLAVGAQAGASGAGAGKTGAPAAATLVHSGEYIERAAGHPFARPRAASGDLRARLPADLQQRVVRRVQRLRERGVPPRQIRRVRREDRERYLHEHPHLRQRMEQRFGELLPENATRRDDVLLRRQQMQQNDHERPPLRRPRLNAVPAERL